jgi:hypothetical protein
MTTHTHTHTHTHRGREREREREKHIVKGPTKAAKGSFWSTTSKKKGT